jgi:hypothetical protein
MKLSQNFSFSEFTRSQYASRNGLVNEPPDDSIAAIRLLVERVLQPARTHFGVPMTISSGYRSPTLNRAIGGSRTSQHVWTDRHAAADFEIRGIDNLRLARWIEAHCEFDQLISECYVPGDPDSGWIHASIRTDGKNRAESLTYQRGCGYTPGLPG